MSPSSRASCSPPQRQAHVYQVSPVLTLVEKHTTKYLASLFGLPPSTSGGISQPGGSASNSTAIVIARNTLFPQTKQSGNGSLNLVLFTSAHGHYSIEKAANMLGLGSANVISVPVNAHGQMDPAALEQQVLESKARGQTPFFLNATAGTTVLGSFDPFAALTAICKKHGLWLHIDGSWGASVVFNETYATSRLRGADLADSITFTPHKMLGVPLTCSFLLGRDMRTFHKALTLPASYLFHGDDGDGDGDGEHDGGSDDENEKVTPDATAIYDLGDLTPQCGRRADSLKLFLALQYHGPAHFSARVARAFENAEYLVSLLRSARHQDQNDGNGNGNGNSNGNGNGNANETCSAPNSPFTILSPTPLPNLQVCFYYTPNNPLSSSSSPSPSAASSSAPASAAQKRTNILLTKRMVRALAARGFMVDYATGDRGAFFRVVVHGETRRETLEGLVRALGEVGEEIGRAGGGEQGCDGGVMGVGEEVGIWDGGGERGR